MEGNRLTRSSVLGYEIDSQGRKIPTLVGNNDQRYKTGQISEDALQNAMVAKDSELSKDCNNAILNGFDYVINGINYHFSFDTEAQLNFQGSERLLSKGTITEIPWTVKLPDGSYERIQVDMALMNELEIAILNHKNNNVSKYRDTLLPKVYASTTIDEVNAITWDAV